MPKRMKRTLIKFMRAERPQVEGVLVVTHVEQQSAFGESAGVELVFSIEADPTNVDGIRRRK
jgi:hypothetical protein